MNKCPRCQHIYQGEHTCPTPEYIAARNRLVSAAAVAEEQIPYEELEQSNGVRAESNRNDP